MRKVSLSLLSTVVVAALLLGATGVAAQAKQDTLYKRLGGYDALAAVTDDFIGRLAADKQLGKVFVGHSSDSLARIRQLIVDQLCNATGGPCVYIGRSMKVAHAGLGITNADWDVAVKHLVATLDKFKVPQKEKDEVLAAVSTLKADIVAPAAAPAKKP
ncbi:MAG: group 1 truncated hemoglobin [Acidobacteria bacterium]|nr:group 1 truncated hemoglobin [Acidobacteriota bacterium]MCL5288652.1 group 1 truncated hemoglobin [Acidobacteriota bacterium]